MNTESENTVEPLLRQCIDLGEQLRPDNDHQNAFFRHLNNLRAAKEMKLTVDQLYLQQPELNPFQGTQKLPGELKIDYLGGFVSPVYRVTNTKTGETIALKGSNHLKPEYIESLKVLNNNPNTEQNIIGGHPQAIGKDSYAETNYELWPIQQGGDLVSKMATNAPLSQQEKCNQWTDILIQTLNQLSRLENLDTPLYMTDLKPGNIYFNEHNQVQFADLKGIMNVAAVQRLNDIDTSPGYQPEHIIDSQQPIDLKALSLYQLAVTAECFLKGQTLGERFDSGELVKDFSNVYVNDGNNTPFSPTLSELDTNTPDGIMVKMTMDYLCQASSASLPYQTMATMVSNLNTIKTNSPDFFDFLHESKELNPLFHNKMLDCLGKGANSTEELLKMIDKEMKSSKKSFLPIFKGQDYKDWRALKVLVQSRVFRTNEELIVQDKYNRIFSHMQDYRNIQNQLDGITGTQLSDTDKKQLYQDLNKCYQHILQAHTEYKTQLSTSSDELQQRFGLAETRALGDEGLYLKVLAARHNVLMGRDLAVASKWEPQSSSSRQSEAKQAPTDANQNPETNSTEHNVKEPHEDVKSLVEKFEQMIDKEVKSSPSSVSDSHLDEEAPKPPKR